MDGGPSLMYAADALGAFELAVGRARAVGAPWVRLELQVESPAQAWHVGRGTHRTCRMNFPH